MINYNPVFYTKDKEPNISNIDLIHLHSAIHSKIEYSSFKIRHTSLSSEVFSDKALIKHVHCISNSNKYDRRSHVELRARFYTTIAKHQALSLNTLDICNNIGHFYILSK